MRLLSAPAVAAPAALLLALACAPEPPPGVELRAAPLDPEDEPDDPIYFEAAIPGLFAYDCAEHKDTGYVQGKPFEITVVTVDGKPVELATADAYIAMQAAAADDGVALKIVSGFRTMAEQQYLYNCYINCNCNNCNLAAKPGYSNHQSGHALDLNSGAPGVDAWLKAHGGDFGFSATVPGEPWHWEWWGGGPPTSGPCGKPLYAATPTSSTFPAADAPPLVLQVGETHDGYFRLRNDGKRAWSSITYLAPLPKDAASPLADPSWAAPSRVTHVDADTPNGEEGDFAFTIRGNTPGDYVQTFALVDEVDDGVTWFADGLLSLHVIVIDPPPPLPGGTTGNTTGDTTDASTTGTSASDTSTSAADPTGDGDSSGGAAASTSPATGASGDAGAEVDDGCGCRTGGAPPLALVALALAARRRRRVSPE